MSVNYNWDKARMIGTIAYYDPVNDMSVEHVCEMPSRITTKTSFNYRPIHGLNHWNNGVIELPPDFTFYIALPAVSPTTRLLRTLQTSGIPFVLELKDEAETDEFKLNKETFRQCRINTKDLSVMVADVPAVIFTGFALEYTFNVTVDGISTPVTDADALFVFGDGTTISTDTNLFDEWVS